MDEVPGKSVRVFPILQQHLTDKKESYEKYLDDLVLYYGNGKFSISKETLNFSPCLYQQCK